jgi:imidazolonepropionase-like amidohydrolase
VRDTVVEAEEGSKLESLQLPGGMGSTIGTVAAGVEELSVSPDGQWLAVRQAQDVYVVPADSSGAPVDVLGVPEDARVQRVTKTGGGYAHWRKDGRLELASAGDYVIYDPKTKAAQSHELGLHLPRAIGKGVIALTGGRVITMKDRNVLERGTVLVRDGRIACVGECEVPAGAKTLDVSGKTLMPGMFDVHAHAFREDGNDEIISLKRAASAAYIAYGVTTIHDPDSVPLPSFTIHDMVEAGRIVGPRTYSTGLALRCIDEARDQRLIRTLDDALEHVDRKKRLGVLSVKDYLQCTRVQREMLAEAARLRGMTVTTEMGPPDYMLSQTMNGHTGWEHSLQFALYRDYVQFFGQAGATYSSQAFLSGFSHDMALEYWFSNEPLLTDPKARRWTPWQRAEERRLFIKKPIAEYMYPVVARDAGRIKAAGGRVAVGAHGEVDGVGTHWEVWTLASGMPNAAALEAATIDSAHFLGLEGELGSLEPGKIADLLVLDANPLENIRNTATLQWTMKAGVLYSVETLDEIWPVQRSYGPLPWVNEEILRDDIRGDVR